MHRTVIKAVKLIRIFCQAVLRYIEQMRIACRQAFLPLQTVRLMIADKRCQRHSITEHAHAVEPGTPLARILSVVHQITHIHVKRALRMTLVRLTRQLLPAAVISALRIRKNQGGEASASFRMQPVPLALIFCAFNAVLIRASRCKAFEAGSILDNAVLICKAAVCCLHCLYILAALLTIFQRIGLLYPCLPHNCAGGFVICRDKLTRINDCCSGITALHFAVSIFSAAV